MAAPTASLTELSPLTRVLTKTALRAVGIELSNPTLGRMEKRGDFPKRFYLSAKSPVWNALEISEWLAQRQAAAGPNPVTAKATRGAQTPAAKAKRRQTRASNGRRQAEIVSA